MNEDMKTGDWRQGTVVCLDYKTENIPPQPTKNKKASNDAFFLLLTNKSSCDIIKLKDNQGSKRSRAYLRH